MGFLKRMFGGGPGSGDPRRDLERAEGLLDKGEVERALELALHAAEHLSPAQERSATDLVARAREALVKGALEKVELAESSEYFEDAVEWLETALEHVSDPVRRAELETWRDALFSRAEQAQEEDAWEPPSEAEVEQVTELDPEAHYMALIDMLQDRPAEHYVGLPAAFRSAYVDLNEGRPAEALAVLDDLAEGSEDPALHLERGRCRLMLGDAEGAESDLEVAWKTFGDETLDRAGEASVPVFWAEAMLALGRGREVLVRLSEQADPRADMPLLTELYAEALISENRLDEARRFLTSAALRFPSRPSFPHQLALALGLSGDRAGAIDCLEAAIAPSCVTGGCAKPQKHLPSIRALASLYLDEGGHADRVHQLMTLIAQDLRGHLSSEDHSLLGRYYDEIGDSEAAYNARSKARQLLGVLPAADSSDPPALGAVGAKRPPL